MPRRSSTFFLRLRLNILRDNVRESSEASGTLAGVSAVTDRCRLEERRTEEKLTDNWPDDIAVRSGRVKNNATARRLTTLPAKPTTPACKKTVDRRETGRSGFKFTWPPSDHVYGVAKTKLLASTPQKPPIRTPERETTTTTPRSVIRPPNGATNFCNFHWQFTLNMGAATRPLAYIV
ncbi:hypothetical protein B0H10DRAFT_1964687 [Mycena sp. CBHHK59/15]|nr:hypothetical protein B0H10DRAFT_1964687 [Mycena sp. CBHHK59/15]